MKALKIASELQDRIGEAVVCANLGSNYEMLGDITSALEYHQKVLCDFDHYIMPSFISCMAGVVT